MNIVIAGGNGDLALRMLLPSLYFLDADGLLPEQARIIGVARRPVEREAYADMAHASMASRHPEHLQEEAWTRFAARLDYLPADLSSAEGAAALKARIGDGETIFYLAISPSLYEKVCESLLGAGLAQAPNRVVLEKPIGRDAASSRTINAAVARAFSEERTYRIDHYLGKETVQNLIALRFGNTLFEPLWSNQTIDHVQITVAETEAVGDRWPYYDDYGALRDMLQNHMLQLLSLVAMEPPTSLDADSVRSEKVKLVRSLRPIGVDEIRHMTVRGQYRAGTAKGAPAPSYLEECGHPTDTETFVAIHAHVDNWRWSGVPFLLRTGKRMATKRTQIAIQFKPVPHSIFRGSAQRDLVANQLVIDLQPDEDISLLLMNKTTELRGGGFRLSPLPLSLSLAKAFGGARRRIAYERLLLDVIENNSTLFVRRDEIEASWAWIDGLRAAWAEAEMKTEPYDIGGWGPPGAYALAGRSGRNWHE